MRPELAPARHGPPGALSGPLSPGTAPGAITAAYRAVGASCNTCHKVYRATDENNQFIIKPGTVS